MPDHRRATDEPTYPGTVVRGRARYQVPMLDWHRQLLVEWAREVLAWAERVEDEKARIRAFVERQAELESIGGVRVQAQVDASEYLGGVASAVVGYASRYSALILGAIGPKEPTLAAELSADLFNHGVSVDHRPELLQPVDYRRIVLAAVVDYLSLDELAQAMGLGTAASAKARRSEYLLQLEQEAKVSDDRAQRRAADLNRAVRQAAPQAAAGDADDLGGPRLRQTVRGLGALAEVEEWWDDRRYDFRTRSPRAILRDLLEAYGVHLPFTYKTAPVVRT